MTYLVTGGAGFIGSNIAEELIRRGCKVRIMDNYSTGKLSNLSEIDAEIFEGDIRDFSACQNSVKGIECVIHQAALASVPRSIKDPGQSTEVNVNGTLNLLIAARDAGVRRFVYASSSSVYGNSKEEEKREDLPTQPLSPYAVSKLAAEQYCRIFYNIYGLETISLRYFNVFGMKQDPESQYAAVIPKFVKSIMKGNGPTVYGDGTQSRDFTFIQNVVDANLLACAAPSKAAGGVFNIACNKQHSILELVNELSMIFQKKIHPYFEPDRAGDVKHSKAAITLAKEYLGYEPNISFQDGLKKTVNWYLEKLK